jgi:ATP-dependent RNA helicase DeaD
MQAFEALGIAPDIISALAKKGFSQPTPIQAQTIPLLLGGAKDIIGQAATGTGKTAAFGLPILQKIESGRRKVQALVLTPTRELAMQVTEEIISFKGTRNLFVLPVYGGQGMDYQIKSLRKGVDLVVGTPGRVIDHLEKGIMDLSELKFLVLDEADEMLNMGFVEEIEKILSFAPKERQTLLFSATMPDRILQLARKYMGDYDLVRIKKEEMKNELIEQVFYEVYNEDKMAALCRIIDTAKDFYSLIFCKTKTGTDDLAMRLTERGYEVEALHGDVAQVQRERIMKKFKSQHATILIATDVAARGIDVNNLTHVVNYDLAGDAETYTHRIGRTGRAGNKGVAVSFVTPSEISKLNFISRTVKMEIKRGQLPTVSQVIESKKTNILHEVNEMLEEEETPDYLALAEQCLSLAEPADLVASMLRSIYGAQLQDTSYPEIREIRKRGERDERRSDRGSDRRGNDRGNDRGGDRPGSRWGDRDRAPSRSFGGGDEGGDKVRLFFARGTMDRVNTRSLLQFLQDEGNIPGQRIQGVTIFQKHSLFTVSNSDAEAILGSFRTPKGTKPLIRRDRM